MKGNLQYIFFAVGSFSPCTPSYIYIYFHTKLPLWPLHATTRLFLEQLCEMKKYISKDDSPSSMFVEHLRPCFADLKVDFTMMWKMVTSYRAKNGIALHLAMLWYPHEISCLKHR